MGSYSIAQSMSISNQSCQFWMNDIVVKNVYHHFVEKPLFSLFCLFYKNFITFGIHFVNL